MEAHPSIEYLRIPYSVQILLGDVARCSWTEIVLANKNSFLPYRNRFEQDSVLHDPWGATLQDMEQFPNLQLIG